MTEPLVVRVFNVAVGDCIYVGVPDGAEKFHILVDCGTRGGKTSLTAAIDEIKKWLPPARDRRKGCSRDDRWLDLLVVTHPDSDHINGFDMQRFKDLRIGQIWLNPLLNTDHPQHNISQSHALMELARSGAQALMDRHTRGFLMLDEHTLERLIAEAESKKVYLDTLLRDLDPDACPRRFMYRDLADPDKRLLAKGSEVEFKFEKKVTCFCGFKDPTTKIRILAPEWDIDGTYLGLEGAGYRNLLEHAMAPAPDRVNAPLPADGIPGQVRANDPKPTEDTPGPQNIGAADFWQLRHGMQYSALSFLWTEKFLQNNTSLVLLVEWKGRRLLFPGDAQCDSKRSSWNIMLDRGAKPHLTKTLDFLKVGHHGSANATPYKLRTESNKSLLDTLLSKARSRVVVSTKAGTYDNMPDRTIMEEALGPRASNATKYEGESQKQPQRTDKENKPYIEVLIPPSD